MSIADHTALGLLDGCNFLLLAILYQWSRCDSIPSPVGLTLLCTSKGNLIQLYQAHCQKLSNKARKLGMIKRNTLYTNMFLSSCWLVAFFRKQCGTKELQMLVCRKGSNALIVYRSRIRPIEPSSLLCHSTWSIFPSQLFICLLPIIPDTRTNQELIHFLLTKIHGRPQQPFVAMNSTDSPTSDQINLFLKVCP